MRRGQPLPLALGPPFEFRCIRDEESVEKGTRVQANGLLQPSCGQRDFELRDIARDDGRIQPQIIESGGHRGVAEFLADGVERLRQRVTSVLRVPLGPEIGQQLVPAHTAIADRGEEGEEGQTTPLGAATAEQTSVCLDRYGPKRPQPQCHRTGDDRWRAG